MDKRTKVQLQPVRSIFKLYPYLVLTIIEVNIMNCRQKKNKPSKIVPSNCGKKTYCLQQVQWQPWRQRRFLCIKTEVAATCLQNTYGFYPNDTLKLKITLENMFGENSMKCFLQPRKHKKGNRILFTTIFEESMYCVRRKNITSCHLAAA